MELYLDKSKKLWQKVDYCIFLSFVLENIQTKERKYVPVNVLFDRNIYKRFIPEEPKEQQ